jgi:fumarate reductase subunit C/ferredoxin
VEPLHQFPIVRDLVVDQSGFLDKLASVKPWLVPRQQRALAAGVQRHTPQQIAKYLAYSQCINCLLCCAACPQFGLDDRFTGPAALALLHRYCADSRDAGWDQRREVVNAEQAVWGCTLAGYCPEVWPKAVDPAHAINQNKVNSRLDYFGVLRLMMPRGGRLLRAPQPVPKACQRSMRAWWRRNPYFVRCMLREASALFLSGYALALLFGLWRLSQGPAAFEAWRIALATRSSIGLHTLGLGLVLYHARTWFRVMPKTTPALPLPTCAVTAAGAAAGAVPSLLVLAWLR